MKPQARVRKMRQPGRHPGRSTDSVCQVYYNPAIRAARIARDRELRLRGRHSRTA